MKSSQGVLTSRPLDGRFAQAQTLRAEAAWLLQRLEDDRCASERRLADTGRRDPLRAVTGLTAMERAIATTREMIAEMDLLLAEAGDELRLEESASGQSAEPQSASDPPADAAHESDDDAPPVWTFAPHVEKSPLRSLAATR